MNIPSGHLSTNDASVRTTLGLVRSIHLFSFSIPTRIPLDSTPRNCLPWIPVSLWKYLHFDCYSALFKPVRSWPNPLSDVHPFIPSNSHNRGGAINPSSNRISRVFCVIELEYQVDPKSARLLTSTSTTYNWISAWVTILKWFITPERWWDRWEQGERSMGTQPWAIS
jgi:hypothetical protein